MTQNTCYKMIWCWNYFCERLILMQSKVNGGKTLIRNSEFKRHYPVIESSFVYQIQQSM